MKQQQAWRRTSAFVEGKFDETEIEVLHQSEGLIASFMSSSKDGHENGALLREVTVIKKVVFGPFLA